MNSVKVFPELTDIAKQFHEMAKSREDYTNLDRKTRSPKDTKAFWFLLGYWSGQNSLMTREYYKPRSNTSGEQ